jgi:hypothetical protein
MSYPPQQTGLGGPTGVTLDALNSKPKPEQSRIVRSLMRSIDASILSAHGLGMNQICYDLDVIYDIPGLTHDDARLYVYSEIVDLYKKKGFEHIKLIPSLSKTTLKIRWINSLSDEERERRRQIIREVKEDPIRPQPPRNKLPPIEFKKFT